MVKPSKEVEFLLFSPAVTKPGLFRIIFIGHLKTPSVTKRNTQVSGYMCYRQRKGELINQSILI